MTDIFHEVEEDLRRDKLQKIWKQYGDYIIAGVAVLVIGVAGWQFWVRYDASKKAAASAAYEAAHVAAASNDLKKALSQFDKVAADSPSGYQEVATLSKANALAASGKPADAIATYKAFSDKYKDPLGDAARVRAAWLMSESAKAEELAAFLKPVTDKPTGFGPMGREVVAYGYYRNGNVGEAQKLFDAIAKDGNAPQNLRQRAGAMATFIKTGGKANYGTVPKVEEKPAAPVTTAPQGTPTP